MTIKQQGGIFGRNPTFDDVSANSLTIAGNAVPDASTILVDGDIGSTVQAYDEDTAKLDVAQTFTAVQTFNENIVMANTKGIDFSATSGTGTSELFDDYEEGSFTPEIVGTSSAGTGTYSANVGFYTKVGRLVSFQIYLNWTAHTGTGDMNIDGLPFTVTSNCFAGVAVAQNNISLTAGNILQAYTAHNSNIIALKQYSTGGGAQANVPIDTAGTLLMSGSYVAA